MQNSELPVIATLPTGRQGKNDEATSALQGKVQEDVSEFSHRFDRQLGFHKQGFYTHVVDVDQCYLISQSLHEVYAHIKTLCQES